MTASPLRPLAALCFSAGLAASATAAGVKVSVTDAAGKPAPDAVVLLEPAAGKPAVRPMEPVDVSQAKRTFNPRVSVITVGTPVNFPNFDTVRHHVYSFSPAKVFELKLYSGVPGKPIVFDKPGVVILGCNIHDTMAAWILVAETPWHGLAGADGVATVAGVPAGSYRLRVWHPAMPVNTEAPAVNVQVGAADLALSSRLTVNASSP
ncbi:methylamine utilization protein [Piscinibacter sakaiensis]|uniref:Protein containing plastocyanin/azurin family domain n=1 Tax=Piscinibacter sakaiensis TaxID=1547922 RepID=A0A0K8P2F3_PISS1|nr:methylamine utilization protein [Piscinibacter sakaiensis]GAP36709.1 protein containing plastocyanin/azurin family domain [Piscinibacter sakaiensis]